MQPTDKELVQAFIRGNQKSFEKLKERYQPTIIKILRRETSKGGFYNVLSINFTHTIEDLESETWVKIFKAITRENLTYKDDMLGGLIATIAKNIASDFMTQRINKRKSGNSSDNFAFPRHGDIEVDEPDALPNNDRSPEAETLDEARMVYATSKLSERSQKVLFLKSQGFTKEEISSELGISISTVSNDLRKIQSLEV
mgnify:FL=1